MLIKQELLARIAEGNVTLAFRCWRQPRVKEGGTLRTAAGVIRFGSVRPVAAADIRERDARLAGYESRRELFAELSRYGPGGIYRIELTLAGPDPRIALRNRSRLSADDAQALLARLDRFDAASRDGPWTGDVLRGIQRSPGVPAGELAQQLGRHKERLKRDVRKLKNLGLTESLTPGYRLSPRGKALLQRLGRRSQSPKGTT